MKKTTVLILCLALVSLACMWTASPMVTETADAIAPGDALVVVTSTAVPRSCARVTAEQALNLRMEPNERARVLTWLEHDDLAQVIDQSNADWWLIGYQSFVGYARSVYLVIQECDEH